MSVVPTTVVMVDAMRRLWPLDRSGGGDRWFVDRLRPLRERDVGADHHPGAGSREVTVEVSGGLFQVASGGHLGHVAVLVSE